MSVQEDQLKRIVEAALMAADEPLTVDRLVGLFGRGELEADDARGRVRDALKTLEEDAAERGYELKRVASGYRYQVRQELSEWVSRLWDEKPPRYSRALLETLALIAYKQPVTRGDIEQVRGVSISQSIMRTLLERGWVRVVGQREVPGKPSLYGTTRGFLDYFDLKSLDQLPPLDEIKSLIEPLLVEEVVDEARRVVDAEGSDDEFDIVAGEVTGEANSETEPTADAETEVPNEPFAGAPAESGPAADELQRHGAGEPATADPDAPAGQGAVAEATEQEADGEDRAEPDDLEQHLASAEVVRLPTSPRR